jgi:hypothetical protein
MSWRELARIIIIVSLYFTVAASLSENPAQKSGIIYSANEIMELIKSGQNVSCTDATIIGDIKLTGLNLIINNNSLKMVNSSISIINSEIKGNIDFGNAFFQESLAFEGSTFSGEYVNFRNSEFASDIDFSGAKFNCMADFSGAKINGSMAFVKTRWSEGAIFDKIMCEDATFRNNVFQSTLSLKDAVMNGSVDFKDCQFNKEVSLSNSTFIDRANFLATSFSGLAELKGTTFSKPAIPMLSLPMAPHFIMQGSPIRQNSRMQDFWAKPTSENVDSVVLPIFLRHPFSAMLGLRRRNLAKLPGSKNLISSKMLRFMRLTLIETPTLKVLDLHQNSISPTPHSASSRFPGGQ